MKIENPSFMNQLSWRYAARSFDVSKPVEGVLKTSIIEAARMAPTSFGLQPFEIYVVNDAKVKEEICAAGFNQPQYKTSAHIICFIARSDIMARIEEYMQLMTKGNADVRAKLKGFEDAMKGSVGKFDGEAAFAWSARQAYIALGFAMAACAELGVDSCPMEGFNHAAVSKVLKLKETERPVVLLPIGHREAEAVIRPKVRFPVSAIVKEI